MPILTLFRRGLIYFCLHVATLVIVLAMSKNLMTTYGFGEVLFMRNVTPLIALALYLAYKTDLHPWQSERWKKHLLRGFVGFANMVLLYLSIKLLPLALALTIRQLEAFIWVALAAWLYHEKVVMRQWIALAIGFLGVVLVLRPALEMNVLGACTALLCAGTGAFVRVLSRDLSRTESSMTIVFYNFVQWSLLSALFIPWTWQAPATADWLPILAIGAVVLASQWLMTEGMALVPAPRLAPFRHTEIFWAGLLGWLMWHEPVGGWFIAGSTLIVIGGMMANWRKLTLL